MYKRLIVLGMLLHFAVQAPAQVSIGVGFQTDSLNISLSSYPNLVRVPGYPVYYAAGMNSNYFFYDGMYWVYEGDRWYSSTWYNGPWMVVAPEFIPLYLLRVPVRYYRHPPAFFGGWQANSPPRWGDHWGHDWAQRRTGWDRWNHRAMPAPAPLPSYQRKYSGDRYPSRDQQPLLQRRNYRHEARDPLVRQQSRAAPAKKQFEPDQRSRQSSQPGKNPESTAARPNPRPSARPNAPAAQPAHRARDNPQPQHEPNRGNLHPQAAANPQHGPPSNENRSAPGQRESGQRSGPAREHTNTDERGPGGRR